MSVTLESLKGRIVDLDSHLMLTAEHMLEFHGPAVGSRLNERRRKLAQAMGVAEGPAPESAGHPDEIWTTKGQQAYGAFTADDRVRALDTLGLDRQLVFPSGMWPAQYRDTDDAHEAVRRYNDFVLDWAKADPRRLRPAAIVNCTNVDKALAEARRTIDAGAHALQFVSGLPPAALSPAAPAWEPMWSMIEDAGIPMLFHTGGQRGVIDDAWMPPMAHLKPRMMPGGDATEIFGPWQMETTHIGPELFMTAMIFGGVLERHPDLHIGAIELGARWVGPWCDRMDAGTAMFRKRMDGVLPLKPSEYVSRQVRVTPFYGEPVGEFIECYGLEDVYVFSTDYPHPEGGNDPIERFHSLISHLGDAITEKFYVTNGRLLLPDHV